MSATNQETLLVSLRNVLVEVQKKMVMAEYKRAEEVDRKKNAGQHAIGHAQALAASALKNNADTFDKMAAITDLASQDNLHAFYYFSFAVREITRVSDGYFSNDGQGPIRIEGKSGPERLRDAQIVYDAVHQFDESPQGKDRLFRSFIAEVDTHYISSMRFAEAGDKRLPTVFCLARTYIAQGGSTAACVKVALDSLSKHYLSRHSQTLAL